MTKQEKATYPNNAAKTAAKKDKMNVRDYVTTAVMIVLLVLVHMLLGSAVGMTAIGTIFVYAVDALVMGTIFYLLYTKVNKNGAPLLVGVVMALFMLMNFWVISIFLLLGGIVAEIIWHKLDKKKTKTMCICFTVQMCFWYLGNMIPLIFLKDLYFKSLPSYEELYGATLDLIVGPLFFVGLAATVVGCIIGSFIGKLLLKKHFQKAGIV